MSSKQQIEKVVFMIFIGLVVFDVSRFYMQREPPPITPLNDQNKNKNNEFNDDHSDQAFQEFKQQKQQEYDHQNSYQDNSYQDDNFQDNYQKQQRNTKKKGFSYTDIIQCQILYCSAYNQNFQTMQQALQQRYPNMEVIGLNYPAPQPKAMLAQMVTYAQYGFLGFSMFGDKVFGYLQMPYPSWYLVIREKKWQAGLGVFFLGNMINGFLVQSGAFEIYLNDKLIFSKLETGRLPTDVQEIVILIQEKLE